MRFLLQNKITSLVCTIVFILSFVIAPVITNADFNQQINYQGKLTDSSGLAVADGTYNMYFWLVASSTAASSTAVWSEVRTVANKVQVTNGLFSVMLGEVTSLAGVDFNQTLYLGVEIGGTGASPVWDGEMSPRKILGAVPAAFEAGNAQTLDNLATTSFLRADEIDAMQATSSSALLTLIQNGAGKIISLFSGVTEMFTVLNNGNVGIATTTPSHKLTVVGNTYLNGDLTVTGTSSPTTLAVTGTATSTLAGPVSLANGEFINNSTDGTVKICGSGGTYNQCLNIGLKNQYFTTLSQSTINGSSAGIQFGSVLNIANDVGNIFGNQSPTRIIYRSTGSGSLNLETYVNGGQNTSGYIIIGEVADSRPAPRYVLDPTLRIFSSDNAQVNDYLDLYHNQTDAVLGWGNGNLLFGNGIATSTISSTGSFGIGTTTPSHKLTVVGNTYLGGNLSLTGSLSDSVTATGTSGQVLSSTGTSTLWTSASSLGLGDGTFLGLSDTQNSFTANRLIFTNSGATALTDSANLVFDGTNFGIGSTTPSSKLTVAGSVDITNTATSSAAITLRDTIGGISMELRAGTSTLLNTFVGVDAGKTNTTGSQNTANGASALGTNSSGSDNTAIGSASQVLNTTGSYNTVAGSKSLFFNQTGFANSVFGNEAGYGAIAQSFSSSTLMGYRAGYAITTGSRNNLFGYRAGDNITSGQGNIILGYDIDAPSATANNQLSIGNLIFGTSLDGTGTSLSSGNIGIGTTTPNSKLTVYGDINISDSSQGYKINNNRILYASTTNLSTLVGNGAGQALLSDGSYNTAFGYQSLYTATSSDNNTAVGYGSLYSNTTGYSNTATGLSTLNSNTTGSYNTANGFNALYSNTNGSNNIAVGYSAGSFLTNGASANASTSNSVFLGYDTRASIDGGINEIVIGAQAIGAGSNTVTLGSTTITKTILQGNVGIGSTTPSSKLTVQGDINISDTAQGYKLGNNRILYASTTNSSTLVGDGVGRNLLSDGLYNTALGYQSLYTATSSDYNTAVGSYALNVNTTGSYNTANGMYSLTANTTGSFNTANGYGSLYNNTGSNNATNGSLALANNVTGSNNVAEGYNAGRYLANGSSANASTSKSLFLGYDTRASANGNINEIVIGAQAIGAGSNTVTLGSTTITTTILQGSVGIGSTTPSHKLTVIGNTYLGGNLSLTGSFSDSVTATGTSGQILSSTGTSTLWTSASGLGLGDGTFLGLSDTQNSFTANRLIFTNSGATALTDSADLTFDGTNFGVGSQNGISFGGTRYLYASSTNDSVAFGENAGATFNSGTTFNTAIGFEAGRYASSTNTDYNNTLGYYAGYNNISHRNNIIGYYAGYNNSGARNNLIGDGAGYNNSGSANDIIGYEAGYSNSGTGNVLMGGSAGKANSGSYNNIFGTQSGFNNSGSYNNIFGYYAGHGNNGNYNEIFGYQAGQYMKSTSSIVIGSQALRGDGLGVFTAINNVAIGYQAGYNATTSADNNILIGYKSADNLTTGSGNIIIGYDIDATSTTMTKGLNIGNLIFGTGVDGTGTSLSSGNIGIGTSTPVSRLAMEKLSYSTAGIAGINQYFTFNNSVASAVQYGNFGYLYATNTATTTIAGNMFKIEDSTLFGNTVRGFEVQTDRGTNTLGENTALSGFARTFGIRGTTQGDAGGTYEPAGVFGETAGTTQGNAIRAYSSSITTASLLKLFQASSTFAGTGLLMNFGNSGGSFSSTTASKFIDLQNAGTSMFTVGAYGKLTIGDGTTNNNAGIQVGYGGICVDNDGSCNASTTGRVSAVSYHTGNSDLAEMYFSSESLKTGEVVYVKGGLSIGKADGENKEKIIGVVSTKPGQLLGFDDTSLKNSEKGYPIALAGRVPVRLSNENGVIKAGDELMLSSISGVVMKASSTGKIIGTALEDFDENRAYSDTYINQFGDDLVDPVFEPINHDNDPRINDGCYFGGGNASGEEPCVLLTSLTKDDQVKEAEALAKREAEERELAKLAKVSSENVTLDNGQQVKVGQIIMFVDLRHRYLDEVGAEMVSAMTAKASTTANEIGKETVWQRLTNLANNFVDGVLSVLTLRADKVEVKEQLCVDGVCLNADDLRRMLEANNGTKIEEEVGGNNDTTNPETEEVNIEDEVTGSVDEIIPETEEVEIEVDQESLLGGEVVESAEEVIVTEVEEPIPDTEEVEAETTESTPSNPEITL